MIYYANPSTEAIRDEMAVGHLGCIVTPHQGNVTFPDEWDVIADNGCFSDRWTYRHWLNWLLELPRSIRFAVCPDVFDPSGAPCHDATLERWHHFAPMVARHGFVPAFVCQVGCTADRIPTEGPLFLGGTTEWKLGSDAWAIAAQAREHGQWVHMGRVNSKRRFDTARAMGCHSCDGTFLTYGPDTNLPRLMSWLNDPAPMLWEAS